MYAQINFNNVSILYHNLIVRFSSIMSSYLIQTNINRKSRLTTSFIYFALDRITYFIKCPTDMVFFSSVFSNLSSYLTCTNIIVQRHELEIRTPQYNNNANNDLY